jgi:metallo-beta-lactamase family protein
MEITFLGAAGTVTGSKYKITSGDAQILVDCGLFQGLKELRLRNWAFEGLDARDIRAVVLTHAHLDHSGFIPLLVKKGFRGKVYCSQATADLCAVLLPDSGRIQEEDAEYANKKGFSKHRPALALYTEEDAKRALHQFHPVPVHQEFSVNAHFRGTFSFAGHIPGACSVKIADHETEIVFSGDLGRRNDPIMNPPEWIKSAKNLVIESTYGNRVHKNIDPQEALGEIINRTHQRGGKIIMPAFAVGRAQNLLYWLYRLRKESRIPTIPVYLNSPMGAEVSKITYNLATQNALRLSPTEAAEMFRSVQVTSDVEDSKKLNLLKEPAVIVSSSGMATGGRVLHHLKAYLGDPRSTIVLAGYQSPGTRGADLQNGQKEIKIHGEFYRVSAEIATLENTSAHADSKEILQWAKGFEIAPKRVFVSHGEPEASLALKDLLERELSWADVTVPLMGQSFKLS